MAAVTPTEALAEAFGETGRYYKGEGREKRLL